MAMTWPAASPPGMNGGLGAELVFAGQHQHVDVLHAAGGDADGDLAGAGRRWVGDFSEREDLRAAE